MMAYMGRPYGPPPGGFLVRPGSMPGSPYGGGMMYAPAPPGMHPGGPGGPRPQMYPGQGDPPHQNASLIVVGHFSICAARALGCETSANPPLVSVANSCWSPGFELVWAGSTGALQLTDIVHGCSGYGRL